jgi:hypothetical protein
MYSAGTGSYIVHTAVVVILSPFFGSLAKKKHCMKENVTIESVGAIRCELRNA